MPLAAAFMIAWPFNRVRAKVECRKMERLPFTWLYVLRAVYAGMVQQSAIGEFLGMPEQSVDLWLRQLLARNAISCQNDSIWHLTDLGREFLNSPDVEKIVTLPARIAWDCVRGRVSNVLYDDLRARDKRSDADFSLQVRSKIPASRDLSLPQCQRYLEYYLDELGEVFDGAELLHLDYSTRPVSSYRRIYVLLYGVDSAKYEIRVWDNEAYDNESAGLIRTCPFFVEKVRSMFSDDHVFDFLRRAHVKNSDSFRKLRFHPSIISALGASTGSTVDGGITQPQSFRTLPAQGISFLEKALVECKTVIRIVVTETQILEWDGLKELVGHALARGAKCEIVIANSSANNAQRIGRIKEALTKAALTVVPHSERSGARKMLIIVPKETRYPSHWISVGVCDDNWVWCGSDLVPGAGPMQAHFGFYSENKNVVTQIKDLISQQVLGQDEQLYPQVRVEKKRRRTLEKQRLN
jgi:hypothetical protein